MKYEKLIYGLASVVVIAGAVMNIIHLPYGKTILLFGFVGMSIFQTWHVTVLKKKVKELESK